MIELRTLKGSVFYLNADLIQKVEEVPDTLITLVDGKKIWVSESADLIIEKVIFYKRAIHCRDWEGKE